ncbi:hypothetical protein M8C21_027126 [Ambrosia artemisiifolia]|uniref:Uncharacterized protein n=1 Tax=Ambrosia artemisiifolia TaxID=4212 RepID=A0AAD5CAL4_AMBAR|nr:hypothetical protein M8C21_027126 [Ambrosia artemisiifolia]
MTCLGYEDAGNNLQFIGACKEPIMVIDVDLSTDSVDASSRTRSLEMKTKETVVNVPFYEQNRKIKKSCCECAIFLHCTHSCGVYLKVLCSQHKEHEDLRKIIMNERKHVYA